ncbi:hypothetical protein [Paraburkholderia sp.]|uniref:hypothetical protein n=1 Tax=Paraburkholderia sp. TaxID=1926495 RepID=UPI002D4A514F|nr:hypothetical protein [Paraburkholderia sp.]HZZ04636.1 hypothetical protein [Paraburkholderia sp.]
MSKQKYPAIHVAATKENFRRGGHVFGLQARTLALAALHPDAHAAILADKSLVVVETAVHLDAEEAAALPHHEAPHVKAAAARIDALHPAVDEDHAKRAVALADIEADLKQREAAVANLESVVTGRAQQLDARKVELDERSATLDSLEADLRVRLADLDKAKSEFEAAKLAHAVNGSVKGAAPAHGKK